MKPYFHILLGLLLLTMACTKDKPTGIENFPEQLNGKWLYINNENEEEYYFCQGLDFNSKTKQFGIAQQENNDERFCGGEMSYDENTQTISLYCTKDHEHLRMNGEEIRTIQIISLTNDRLVARLADNTMEYSRNNEYYTIPPYVWENGHSDKLNPEGSIPSIYDYGVDLGLSVYWADHNLGANDYFEEGGRYGWGDVTGTYFTKNEAMYPCADPPSDISGSEYDIVAKKWGNGWRLPTKEEMEELIDNCHASWHIWCHGWVFTSLINGDSIQLPYAQIRDGRSTFMDECAYWTSTLDEANNSAYAMYALKSEGKMEDIDDFKRSYGLQIRPVKAKTDSDVPKIIIGTWLMYQEGSDWKSIVEIKADGECTTTDWFESDEEDKYYSEGIYSLYRDEIEFSVNSMIVGSYRFTSVSSDYFEAENEDGYKLCASRME